MKKYLVPVLAGVAMLVSAAPDARAEQTLRRSGSNGAFKGGYSVVIEWDANSGRCLWTETVSAGAFRGSYEETQVVKSDYCESLINAKRVESVLSQCPADSKVLQNSSSGPFQGGYSETLVLTSDCVCKIVKEGDAGVAKGGYTSDHNTSFDRCLRFIDRADHERVREALKN